MVEHIVHIDGVTGSSPVSTTINPPSSDGGFFLISVIGKTELTESGVIIILLLRYIDQIETAFLLNEGDEGNWQSISNACASFWRSPQ